MVCIQITFGLALVVGGIALTWWNEQNLVCTTGAYEMAQAQTRELDTCTKDDDLFGSFLHLTCPVEESLVTSESSTGISAPGAYFLTLDTEQFGYQKTSESQSTGRRTCDKDGKCRDETESCSCLQSTWTTKPVTQADTNIYYCSKCPKTQYTLPPADTIWGSSPATKLGYEQRFADRVPLGDGTLQIDQSDITKIRGQQLIEAPTTPTTIASNSFSLVASEHCNQSGNKLMCFKSIAKRYVALNTNVNATDVSQTVLGDMRLIVKAYGSTTITGIGKYVSNSDGTASIKSSPFGESKLPPCKSRDIFYVTDGTKDPSDIYQELHDGLKAMTTILRVVSFAMIFIGFYTMFSPIQQGADMIPCIGDMLAAIVGCVLYLICALLAIAIWLTVFALAWVFYRPILGAAFLAVAGVFIAIAFSLYRRQVNKNRERGIDMPDDMPEGAYPEAKVVDNGYDNGYDDRQGWKV